jgi:hypothetical protein
MTLGTLGGILVSLVTKPVDAEKLDRFYDLIRTPVKEGEVVEKPCALPAGMTPAPRRNLIPSKSIELMVPSTQAVAGFVVGWVIVGLLIYGFSWLISP